MSLILYFFLETLCLWIVSFFRRKWMGWIVAALALVALYVLMFIGIHAIK